ncbi:MAG TPA: hypothetical protein VII08_13840 [Myxococcales bacterium]
MRNRTPTAFAAVFAFSIGSIALAADAGTAAGYKGIPWGATCSEAVEKMEANGFVFTHKEQVGSRAEARSPWQPHLFLHNGAGPASCSMENSDLEMDTRQANPYVEVRADSGDIAITLLCRNSKFVGARLETPMSNTSAVAMLIEAAGPQERTLRADTCDALSWKCTADHSLLRQRGDAVRYLERPVRASRDYDGQNAPAVRYLVLAESENRALQTAYVACADKKLASDRLDKKRIQDGNRAAVE